MAKLCPPPWYICHLLPQTLTQQAVLQAPPAHAAHNSCSPSPCPYATPRPSLSPSPAPGSSTQPLQHLQWYSATPDTHLSRPSADHVAHRLATPSLRADEALSELSPSATPEPEAQELCSGTGRPAWSGACVPALPGVGWAAAAGCSPEEDVDICGGSQPELLKPIAVSPEEDVDVCASSQEQQVPQHAGHSARRQAHKHHQVGLAKSAQSAVRRKGVQEIVQARWLKVPDCACSL